MRVTLPSALGFIKAFQDSPWHAAGEYFATRWCRPGGLFLEGRADGFRDGKDARMDVAEVLFVLKVEVPGFY